jgi:predicted amidophosphoribosyltransferase
MSRLNLQWFNLTQQEGQDLCLKIPICDIYSVVIDRAFPQLVHIGWRAGAHGTCYTFIKLITAAEQEALNNFLDLLQQLLCLTITPHLAPHFHCELDEAYALDFNFQQGVMPLQRTEVGEVEHLAKDQQDAVAVAEVARRLADVIRRHPTLARADVITAMPPRPASTFHLPVELVNQIGAQLGRSVGLDLAKADHPKLRTLPIDQKLAALADAFTLGEPVQGKSVLVIDDLYQSGTSVWSLAKYLKSQGAREVYALATVKSWSDTDNV